MKGEAKIIYGSRVIVFLEGEISKSLRNHSNNVCNAAFELTFRKIQEPSGAFLAFEKINPILTYKILFYEDRIEVHAAAFRWESLKHFEIIAKAEVDALLSVIGVENSKNDCIYT